MLRLLLTKMIVAVIVVEVVVCIVDNEFSTCGCRCCYWRAQHFEWPTIDRPTINFLERTLLIGGNNERAFRPLSKLSLLT